MDFINKPIAFLLDLCNKLSPNYAITLLLFAFLVKIILLPLGIKQHSNSLKQASIRPLEAAIVKKYKGRNDRASQQKKQEEIQQIQQRVGFSQFAGCLPLLIQFPIIIVIYNIIRSPLTYLCGFEKEVVTRIKDIAKGIDPKLTDEITILSNMHKDITPYQAAGEAVTVGALPDFSLFGLDLSLTPGGEGVTKWLILIPVLTFVFTFFSTKLTKKLSYQSPMTVQQGEDAKLSLTIMDLMLPLLSTWITFSVPAVIGVYWMYQNVLGVLQQLIMVKIKPYPVFSEEDYKEAERQILGKKKKVKTGRNYGKDPDRPRVRSLHHIDDDEYNAKVVEKPQESIPGESKASADPNGLLAPVPMKDYADKNDKKKK